MNKGPVGQGKNSIDNPENADDNQDNSKAKKIVSRKDVVQNQIQESNTQLSFKVKKGLLLGALVSIRFVFAHRDYFHSIVLNLNIFKGPTNDRQRSVVAALKHSWTGYKNHAWGHDNLKPISQAYSDWFGLGLTIIDALDTFYIADMQEEYDEAKQWIETSLKLDVNRDVNLFETTIVSSIFCDLR